MQTYRCGRTRYKSMLRLCKEQRLKTSAAILRNAVRTKVHKLQNSRNKYRLVVWTEISRYVVESDTLVGLLHNLDFLESPEMDFGLYGLLKAADNMGIPPPVLREDASSKDTAIVAPTGTREKELENNPQLIQIQQIRDDFLASLDEEEREHYVSTELTTVQLTKVDERVTFQSQERLLSEEKDDFVAVEQEDVFMVYCWRVATSVETDDAGQPVTKTVDVEYEDLLYQGTKNSATAGVARGYKAKTKSAATVVGAIEAMTELVRAKEKGYMILRPCTIKNKEERVKMKKNPDGTRTIKKPKVFMPADMAMQRLTIALFGHRNDLQCLGLAIGNMVGIPGRHGSFDICLRFYFGKCGIGKGRITKALPSSKDVVESGIGCIETDFANFETSHHPQIRIANYIAMTAPLSGGCRDSMGKIQPHMAVVATSLLWAELLPELRVNRNQCLRLPPQNMNSGNNQTLIENTHSHSSYMKVGLLRSMRKGHRPAPSDVAAALEAPRVGDDGLYADTPTVRKMLDNVDFEPVQLKYEAVPLLTELDDNGKTITKGASLCKANIAYLGGVLVPVRTQENLYKMVMGNKDTLAPLSVMHGAVSNMSACVLHPKIYGLQQSLYHTARQLMLDAGKTDADITKLLAMVDDGKPDLPSKPSLGNAPDSYAEVLSRSVLVSSTLQRALMAEVENHYLTGHALSVHSRQKLSNA